jgi:hypothetical protein
MRFVHKKIPKILVFLHISSGEPGDALVSELPDCRVVRRIKLSGDYNKPANLRHYLHVWAVLPRAKANRSGSHAQRLNGPYRRHAFHD